jgi:hypothetical protein
MVCCISIVLVSVNTTVCIGILHRQHIYYECSKHLTCSIPIQKVVLTKTNTIYLTVLDFCGNTVQRILGLVMLVMEG